MESDQSAGSDLDKNFWVRYRMAIVNQKNPAKTIWKESSICTKTWNNSVLQFMKVLDVLEADAGFLVRDTVIFVCEIMDCCPWFEFSDLEVSSGTSLPILIVSTAPNLCLFLAVKLPICPAFTILDHLFCIILYPLLC